MKNAAHKLVLTGAGSERWIHNLVQPLGMQLSQEKFRTNNASYGDIDDIWAGVTTTENGFYTLAVSNVSSTSYTLTATAQGTQVDDNQRGTSCAAMSLEVDKLTKRFGANLVLRGVDLSLAPGTITAFMGANGAGKSTLARIVCGLTPATAGTMDLAGQPYAPATKADAEAAGMVVGGGCSLLL